MRICLLLALGLLGSFSATAQENANETLQRELQKQVDRLKGQSATGDKAKAEEEDESKPRPLTVNEMAGEWTAVKLGDADVTKTKVTVKAIDDTHLALEGKYKDWKQEGEITDGKVVFTRKPKSGEMSEKAPPWARDDVAAKGELQWKLELKGERRGKEAFLEGKWYPGELQWRTAKGAAPVPVPLPADRQAQYLGPGTPLDVQFKKPIPKFFFYAKCVNGLQSIKELYLGVPTLIEVQFDPEYKEDEYSIELEADEQKLKLVAHRTDQRGIIFRTDFFVPGGQSQAK